MRPPRITAKVVQKLGDPFAPRSFSLIAINKYEIPHVFSPELLAEAERAAKQPLGDDREDLTHLPIVAIDPADARDHDDAIWAAPDDDPANKGGWLAVVAIADVYDALTSVRVYKDAIPHEEAIKMILDGKCGTFNPLLLDCLLEVQDQIAETLARPADVVAFPMI